MKIGVAVATFNEGPDLEVTLAMIRASVPKIFEMVVVDDASTEPIRNSTLSLAKHVTVNSSRCGSGITKRRALSLLSKECDVLVVLDAHMRLPWDWANGIEETIREFPDGLCCLACRGFETDSAFLGSGAVFSKSLLAPEPVWAPRGDKPIELIPCIMGACYFATRRTWERIDYFNPMFYGWGAEEQDASLRSWLSGGCVVRNNKYVVQHNFRRSNPGFMLNSWHPQYNAMVMCATLFEDGVFEEFYEPFMRAHFSAQAIALFEDNHTMIQKHRRLWRPKAVVSEPELFELCGWTHPTKAEQQQKITPVEERPKPATVVAPTPLDCHIGVNHREKIIHAARGREMLEWGSGGSSVKFVEAGVNLTTFEHDVRWSAKLVQFPHGKVFTVPAAGFGIGGFFVEECGTGKEPVLEHHYANAPKALNKKFDVILVDGILRNACLKQCASLLNPGGLIFLHDSQRDWYETGKEGIEWTDMGEDPTYPGPRLMLGRIPC